MKSTLRKKPKFYTYHQGAYCVPQNVFITAKDDGGLIRRKTYPARRYVLQTCRTIYTSVLGARPVRVGAVSCLVRYTHTIFAGRTRWTCHLLGGRRQVPQRGVIPGQRPVRSKRSGGKSIKPTWWRNLHCRHDGGTT